MKREFTVIMSFDCSALSVRQWIHAPTSVEIFPGPLPGLFGRIPYGGQPTQRGSRDVPGLDQTFTNRTRESLMIFWIRMRTIGAGSNGKDAFDDPRQYMERSNDWHKSGYLKNCVITTLFCKAVTVTPLLIRKLQGLTRVHVDSFEPPIFRPGA